LLDIGCWALIVGCHSWLDLVIYTLLLGMSGGRLLTLLCAESLFAQAFSKGLNVHPSCAVFRSSLF
jgi:hypothetical protein